MPAGTKCSLYISLWELKVAVIIGLITKVMNSWIYIRGRGIDVPLGQNCRTFHTHLCVSCVSPPPPLTPEILGSTTIKTLLFVSENRAYMLKQLVIHNCKVLVSVCKILMDCKPTPRSLPPASATETRFPGLQRETAHSHVKTVQLSYETTWVR